MTETDSSVLEAESTEQGSGGAAAPGDPEMLVPASQLLVLCCQLFLFLGLYCIASLSAFIFTQCSFCMHVLSKFPFVIIIFWPCSVACGILVS